jgi:putative oxygen-independent coproporphyrinogen III oxidase
MAGIYIHIPFCKQACYYCDFHFSTSLKHKNALITALSKEIRLRKTELDNKPIETIYFGGGTPSLLTVQEINTLVAAVYSNFTVVAAPEITLEANPDDLSEAKIVALSQSKINRLSIGIQSFFEKDLKLMHRAHNGLEAKACLEIATKYFNNISVDLIYGIPNCTNAEWLANIQTVLSYNIPHISSYALTVEPKTALKKLIDTGKIAPVDEQKAQEQFYILADTLERANFTHYELSNFSKPGFFSKNNSAYWLGKQYLGIGPSAHSFNGIQRSWNVSNNNQYLKAIENNSLPLQAEKLSVTDVYNEYVMTGLRTIWGVSLEKIHQDFGETYKDYLLKQAKKHIKNEVLGLEGNLLLATKKGKFLIDGIAADLFMIN